MKTTRSGDARGVDGLGPEPPCCGTLEKRSKRRGMPVQEDFHAQRLELSAAHDWSHKYIHENIRDYVPKEYSPFVTAVITYSLPVVAGCAW